ncbi:MULTISPECIES: IS110 family transposase [unclassified Neisseria]|uniref:IS110 family transposase n=1 Tax=unclassified Neisseria TaxID=2623750 RepID=UPI001071A33E|nr:MULTISPECIES: IS110 family transposase [unclassified Neisseria]MBF0803903.1 IS110 family transposase [Neisseria sp. 19428wB4_WF04]TFU43330.1 IS110 family transposase [Neisseria sp. WF04]
MYLGIDVSKASIDCCLISDGFFYEHRFSNSPTGYTKLKTWLEGHKANPSLYCCCEATGTYHEPPAEYLNGHYKISVDNPRKIKGFANAVLQRSKTDKQDAKLIARYCKAMNPEAWQRPTSAQKQLQELTRYIARIKKQRAAELTKYQTAPDYLKRHIKATIDYLSRYLQTLKKDLQSFYKANPDYDKNRQRLKTITGIGENAAAVLLATVTAKMKTARQLAAYLGLDPKQNQSGTSINGRPRISKTGKSQERAALYMPALVAYRMKAFPAFIGRLKAKKKPPKLIIVAIMRKLVTIAFHLLKNQTEYDKTRYGLTA